jgi:hypothetical protein
MTARREEEGMGSTPERGRRGRGDERGMALVLALLVLLVLTVIGAALMANVTTETKIAGHKVRDTQALTLAEAGVQEAMLRIRNGEIVDDLNPRNVHLIYNNVAGSLPVSGADTTSLPTLQPAGSYLSYSTVNKNPAVLSVKYKTKAGVILRYDETATPRINTVTGNPIWIIQSTGNNGSAYRSIYAEVTRSRVNVLARSAVTANVGIDFSGNIEVCGHDHRADTPLYTQPPGCNAGVGTWLAPTAHATCLPGAWSSKGVKKKGSGNVIGEPSNWKEYQNGFYAGPWDALGLLQSEFWPWIGAPVNTEPAVPRGIWHLDSDAIKQNGSGAYAFNGGDGEGFIYADGDLQINGSFTYRGLIYAEGDINVNGNMWLLGGLIAKGKDGVKIANGSAVILFSSEAIAQSISKYGGNIRTIAWREL